jgi:zinc protease
MTVVVVGDVVEDLAIAAIGKLFGDWPASTKTGDKPLLNVPDPAPPAARQLVSMPMMNKAQADVVYGFVGVRRSDPDYTAMSVMNNALGQYAIGGKLGDSIRERQGMAYYVYSSLDATFGPGPLVIRAGVAAANVERTIASIDEELKGVIRDGFTTQEIEESKSYMIGSLPRQLETNAGIASFLLNVETFALGLDYDERLPGLIKAVTKEAADAAARRLLHPDKATIAVAGPWQQPSLASAPASSAETAPAVPAAAGAAVPPHPDVPAMAVPPSLEMPASPGSPSTADQPSGSGETGSGTPL